MKTPIVATSLAALFISFTVNANWVCNVVNKKGQRWTFSAPTQSGAQDMAEDVCEANSITSENCSPSCYDNGLTGTRWHCVVSNQQGQHWSYSAPTQAQAEELARGACDDNSINPESCNPTCLPE